MKVLGNKLFLYRKISNRLRNKLYRKNSCKKIMSDFLKFHTLNKRTMSVQGVANSHVILFAGLRIISFTRSDRLKR